MGGRWIDDDRYTDAMSEAAAAICGGNIEAGRSALEPFAGQLWTRRIPRQKTEDGSSAADDDRPPPDVWRSARVFARDRYHCRYCEAKVVPKTFAMLLHTLYPTELPFHDRYKRGYTHPIFWVAVPEVDHVESIFGGGAGRDEANLVTACVACNDSKGTAAIADIGWRLKSVPPDNWNGLTARYRCVWEAAGRPTFGRAWLNAIAQADPTGSN